jgi:hypothetical protein
MKVETRELTDLEIFKRASDGFKVVKFEDLTIDDLTSGGFFYIAPNELFKQGLAIDGFSQSVIKKIFNAINETNKQKMKDVILKDPYKLARFLDNMWEMVK